MSTSVHKNMLCSEKKPESDENERERERKSDEKERKEYCSCPDGSNIRLEQITYLLSLSLSPRLSKQHSFLPIPFLALLSLQVIKDNKFCAISLMSSHKSHPSFHSLSSSISFSFFALSTLFLSPFLSSSSSSLPKASTQTTSKLFLVVLHSFQRL